MIGSIERSTANIRKYLLSQPLIIHSLIIIFGISAWIGINGIYVQLPLLVISAPEGWNLAAYIVVTIQAANIGPIIYTLARKLNPSLDESISIFLLLFVGSLAMILLAIFYQETLYIGNERHSVAMLLCVFFTALVGCTSSVLFMPYLRNGEEKYLIFYFIGEGLSGVVPSVVAFFQGVGGDSACTVYKNGTTIQVTAEPKFSPRDYFFFLSMILSLSFCTFGFLRHLPFLKKDETTSDINRKPQGEARESGADKCMGVCVNDEVSAKIRVNDEEDMSLFRTFYLHVLVGILCFLGNGFLPGVQTYSCLPYGNVAFHLTVTLANIANPIACFLFLWVDSNNLMIFDVLSFVGIVTSIYAIYLAAMSPTPPLRGTALGVAVIISVWVLLTSVISHLKLSITSKIRKKLGSKALVRVGIVMQAGSACGAVLSLLLINYTNMFKQHKSCIPL